MQVCAFPLTTVRDRCVTEVTDGDGLEGVGDALSELPANAAARA